MGYVKDAYDILKNEPEARQWLADTLGKVWNRSADESGPEPTHVQQIKAEMAFADALWQDEFAKRFKDKLSFLGFILARARSAVDLKERGLVLTRFYLKGGALYFPPSHKPAHLTRTSNMYYETVQLAEDDSDDNDNYNFYYVKNVSESPKDLVATLDGIATDHRASEVAALQQVSGAKFELSACYAVRKDLEDNTFELGFTANSEKKLLLNWSTPNEVRNTIADNFLHVLNWTSF